MSTVYPEAHEQHIINPPRLTDTRYHATLIPLIHSLQTHKDRTKQLVREQPYAERLKQIIEEKSEKRGKANPNPNQ